MNHVHQIVVNKKYLATLLKDRRDLQKLFSAGVMDWDGFDDIDWDE